MKPGAASQTAVLVCMARAVADAAPPVPAFSDPTAYHLLPDEARARVERYRTNAAPKSRRERLERVFLERRAQMMVSRTVAIDEAVRVAAAPQVVILGAGLDGRAWRMPELRDAVVFEVDHPDTQREKKARVGALTACAADIRFVPVDFARDGLDEALERTGHDRGRRTAWIWEGVVMYLERAAVEATLAVIEKRSAPGSILTIAYVSPSLLRWFISLYVRRLGEPFRSLFEAVEMRDMLRRFGFRVIRDENVVTIARALSLDLGRAAKPMKHLRIVTAERGHDGVAEHVG